MTGKQNYINHIALVLDASGSMSGRESDVVKVADAQVAYLAQRSKELDQETRITVYTFDHPAGTQCVFYDKDVLRMPSLAGHYKPNGGTPLIDTTLKVLDDLSKTPELYGDHAFLIYVLTDGQENSSKSRPPELQARLKELADHWTVAVLTPDQSGVFEAKKFGFPVNNIAVWNATSAKGIIEVGETIRRATESFMTARATGVRGTKNVFQLATQNLTERTVETKLAELQDFEILNIWDNEEPIREFVERRTKKPYKLGSAYYQLTKSEKIQAQKNIAVLDRATNKVYSGTPARGLLGLPNSEVRVAPTKHPKYEIFVQSTSVNRKLMPRTKLLLLQ